MGLQFVAAEKRGKKFKDVPVTPERQLEELGLLTKSPAIEGDPSEFADGFMDLSDDRELNIVGRGVMLSLEALERHPANRTPATADVAARAKSLQADRQLEDIVVRQLSPGKYQIISGETRCLAAASLDWKEIRCTVIECDDAEALRLVGLFNSQRTDLNPIQKAQHIEAMCAAGMTREEAGRVVGLESGSAASNLVRLLKLPKVWQERVASGELPETWARALLPALPLKSVMAELEKEFKNKPVNVWENWGFDSRRDLEECVGDLLKRQTRRLDETKRHYGDCSRAGGWDATGEYPCLLHQDEIEGNRKKLEIVTLSIDGQDVEVATNTKLFDELQYALIKKRHVEKAAKKAKAAGKKADAGKKVKSQLVKSPDMIKHEAAVRAADLKRDINSWRDRVLRREISAAIRAAKIKTAEPRLMTLVIAFLVDQSSFTSADLFPIVKEALGCRLDDCDENPYCALAEYLNTGATLTKWQNVAAAICAFLIGGDAHHDRPAAIDSETLQALFDEWKCDLTAAWQKLYAAKDPLFEEFLEMHRKEELRTLAKEIVPDLHLAESLGKPQMVALLTGRPRPPALPKCLLPPKKRETKPAGKRGGK